jgi:hypothetical protein
MTRKTGIVAVLLLIISALLCCAAFAQEQQPPPTGEEETPPITPYGEEQPPPTGGEQVSTGYIYLYLNGELSQVERDIMGGSQMVEFAVLELLNGPSEEEAASGYITYIPEGVKLQYTTIKQDRSEFSVNLSRELLSLSGDKEASTKALAQMVKTIRDVSGIESIGITVAGEATGDQPQDAYEALGVSREDVDREISGQEPSSGGGSTGLILAIVFGVLGAGILIFLVVYYLNRRGKKLEEPDKGKKANAKSKAGKKTKK